MSERTEMIQGLRDLADLFENNSELPIPWSINASVFVDEFHNVDGLYVRNEEGTRRKVARLVRMLKPVKKEWSDWSLTITKKFGPVRLSYMSSREAVCRKVVTGT